jgi:hypothetical protein
MSMPEKIISLVNALIAKTANDRAVWVKTSRESEYKLQFETGAVTIDNWASDSVEIDSIDLSIYNKNGDRIETFYYNIGVDEYSFLSRLYTAIHKRYYLIDETIDGIFKEIATGRVIGGKE